MAQLVVSAVGAAVGFVIGGPAGAQIGWVAGSMVGAYAFAENQTHEGPRLKDLKITGTDYGDTIPWVAGSPRIAGQIIWASPRRETRHEEEVGGKGGGGGATQVTYTYDCDLLILLTENPGHQVNRIWLNNELVGTSASTKDGVWAGITVHQGGHDQLPDPVYEAAVGVGNAPAYRGRTTVMIQGLQLGGGGNIPNLTFELAAPPVLKCNPISVLPTTLPALAGGHVITGWNADGTYTVATEIGVSFYTKDGVRMVRGQVQFQKFLASNGAAVGAGEILSAEMPTWGMTESPVFFKICPILDSPVDAFFLHDIHFLRFVRSGGSDLFIVPGAQPAPLAFGSSIRYANGAVWVGGTIGASVCIINLTEKRAHDIQSLGFVDQSVQVFGDTQTGRSFLYGRRSFDSHLVIAEFTQTDHPDVVSWTHDFGTNHGQIHAYGGHLGVMLHAAPADFAHYIIKADGLELCGYAASSNFAGTLAQIAPGKMLRTSTGVVYDVLLASDAAGQATTVPLDVVIGDLLYRAGYDALDTNVSALSTLTKPLRALALSQVSSTRSSLEVLQKCWHFECATTDKLRLRPRATVPVVRIPFADLGYGANTGGLDDPLAIRMGNDLEMPAQIALAYPNIAGDYNADSQFSDRLISGQQSTQTMQVPVGMLPAEAKGVADALLMDAVAGLQSTTLSVPLKYAFVEPGDVVEAVAQDGRIYRLRVQTRKDQGIWLELECKLDDVGALDSAAITDDGYITVQDPASVPDTILHALDVPLLRDADDQPGFYLAAAPDSINAATDQWKGANVASSWDDVDYTSLLSILEAATVGESLTVLPAWNGGPVFDEASVLRVEMLGQLSSTNRAAMLLDESVNALLVGDEVVRFRNAELVDADEDRGRYTYQLTGFIRGFRGTEWAMGSHVAGERCVLLNRGVRRVNTQLNELQVQRWLKATTVGKYITDVQPQAFTNTGCALKPFAPVGLRALTEEGVGVRLSWQRRTRLSYRYGGVSPSVPLGEATERYRVEVWQAEALLRTETVTQPSYDYTATLAATDGLNAGDPVRFEVCQLSESVGAGYTTTKEGFAA